jgi:hypothetical protein
LRTKPRTRQMMRQNPAFVFLGSSWFTWFTSFPATRRLPCRVVLVGLCLFRSKRKHFSDGVGRSSTSLCSDRWLITPLSRSRPCHAFSRRIAAAMRIAQSVVINMDTEGFRNVSRNGAKLPIKTPILDLGCKNGKKCSLRTL